MEMFGSGPVVFIDIHWIIYPQFGCKLFEILFIVTKTQYHVTDQDVVITAVKLMPLSCAVQV